MSGTVSQLQRLRRWRAGSAVAGWVTIPAEWWPSASAPGTNPSDFLRAVRIIVDDCGLGLLEDEHLRTDRERTTASLQDAGHLARAWLDWAVHGLDQNLARYADCTAEGWPEWWRGGYPQFRESVEHGLDELRSRLDRLAGDPWRGDSLLRTIGPRGLGTVTVTSRYHGLAVEHPSEFWGPTRGFDAAHYEVRSVYIDTWRSLLRTLEAQPEIDAARFALCSSRWFRAFILVNLRRGNFVSTNDGSPLGGWTASLAECPDIWHGALPIIQGLDRDADRVVNAWCKGQIEHQDRRTVEALAVAVGYLIDGIVAEVEDTVESVEPESAKLLPALQEWLACLEAPPVSERGSELWHWGAEECRLYGQAYSLMPSAWPQRRSIIRARRALEVCSCRYMDLPRELMRTRVAELAAVVRSAVDTLQVADGQTGPADSEQTVIPGAAPESAPDGSAASPGREKRIGALRQSAAARTKATADALQQWERDWCNAMKNVGKKGEADRQVARTHGVSPSTIEKARREGGWQASAPKRNRR